MRSRSKTAIYYIKLFLSPRLATTHPQLLRGESEKRFALRYRNNRPANSSLRKEEEDEEREWRTERTKKEGSLFFSGCWHWSAVSATLAGELNGQ